MIRIVTDSAEKKAIAREILEALTDWFGITESREKYIEESGGQTMIAAFEDGVPAGFLCLRKTGEATAEIAVMGIKKEYHRCGIGTEMFRAAKDIAAEGGYSFLQVKTVQYGRYEEYDITNLFYRSLGFREFEVFPDLWDENNPCQIYVMYIGDGN